MKQNSKPGVSHSEGWKDLCKHQTLGFTLQSQRTSRSVLVYHMSRRHRKAAFCRLQGYIELIQLTHASLEHTHAESCSIMQFQYFFLVPSREEMCGLSYLYWDNSQIMVLCRCVCMSGRKQSLLFPAAQDLCALLR